MFKSSAKSFSTPKDERHRFDSRENHPNHRQKSIRLQTDRIEKQTKSSNTPNYIDEMVSKGKTMTDEEFEKFLRERAVDCYWKIFAERTRIELDDQLRENKQLHNLLEQLNKENQFLQAKSEHCEYLTHVFNSITSDYDSGIELHITDESPLNKRQKTHF